MSVPVLEFAAQRERYRAGLWKRRRRASVAMVLVSSPSMVLSGMIVARFGALLGRWEMIAGLALWLLVGVPILIFALQVEVVRPKARTDEWTAEQADRLGPAWREVIAAAGVSTADYLLVIQDSQDIRAGARGAWTVEITSGAVQNMQPSQLRGVLAHELGHLLSSRRKSGDFMFVWYAIPLHAVPFLAYGVIALPALFAGVKGVLEKVVMHVGQLVYAATIVWLIVLLLGPRCAPIAAALLYAQLLARRLVLRRGERLADLIAVDLGFGAGMVTHLRERNHDASLWKTGIPRLDRLSGFIAAPLSTHPPVRRRIRAIESRMSARERVLNPHTARPNIRRAMS